MNEEEIKFVTEIIKPWDMLNSELFKAYAISPGMNDYIVNANNLALAIKHIAEFLHKIKPETLVPESRSYEIMSDLADTKKHGELRKPERECKLNVASKFERNDDGKVRFLRNTIMINHNTYGDVDFLSCAMESAKFVAKKLNISIDWTPKIIDNNGEFSDEINLHVSHHNQVTSSGFQFQFVQLNEKGEFENVDLNSTVKLTITSEF